MKRETIQISNGVNLLPPQQKKEILIAKKWRLVLISCIFVLSFLISLSLILFFLKIYISGQATVQRILVESEEELKIPQVQKLEKEITLINEKLLKLDLFYESQPNLVASIEKISETLPKGIYLTALSLNPLIKEENRIQVSLSAYSPSRALMSEFKKRLEDELSFEEIYLSPIYWAKREDIDFSITFQIKTD